MTEEHRPTPIPQASQTGWVKVGGGVTDADRRSDGRPREHRRAELVNSAQGRAGGVVARFMPATKVVVAMR